MAIDLGEQVTRIQIRWEAKKKASAVIFADWKTMWKQLHFPYFKSNIVHLLLDYWQIHLLDIFRGLFHPNGFIVGCWPWPLLCYHVCLSLYNFTGKKRTCTPLFRQYQFETMPHTTTWPERFVCYSNQVHYLLCLAIRSALCSLNILICFDFRYRNRFWNALGVH